MTVICPDDYLMRRRPGREPVYEWSQDRVISAWRIARSKFKQELRSGRYDRVVIMMGTPASGKSHWLAINAEEGVLYFDACHDSDWKRDKARVVALRECPNIPVELVWIDTPVEDCIKRNRLREESRRVPDEVIRKMDRYINNRPPDPVREGFTKMLRIRA